MSWKPEVIADSSGTWASNSLRFASEREAEIYVKDLMMRWSLVTSTRVVLCEDPVNYAIVNNVLVEVK